MHGAKAIEDYRSYEECGDACDRVISRNEHDDDAPLTYRKVLRKFERWSLVMELHIGGRVIGTTAEHPYFVRGKGWTATHDLQPGDEVRLMALGWKTIENVIATDRLEKVYNLEIEEDHTYFVGCDEWGFSVWAHNAGCGPELAGQTLAKDTRYQDLKAFYRSQELALNGHDAAHNAANYAKLKAHLQFQQDTGYTRVSSSVVEFQGLQVRGVRKLDHLSEQQIRFNLENDFAPRAPGRGDGLVLHHHRQQVQGPIIEIPQRLHQNGNRLQHPLGNSGGLGNGPQRQAFNAWRRDYWRARYTEELIFRGLE